MDVWGCRAGTEVDRELGRRAQPNSGALCPYTRHWETHSNTFMYSHIVTQSRMLLPTAHCPHRLTLASRKGSPISSPVLSVMKLVDPLCCTL